MIETSPLWRRALLLLVLLGSQLFGAGAAAQEQATEHERAAKAAFEAGVKAAEAKDYERARGHFERSRQLVVKASTLLNLAVVDLKLGLSDEALEALDALEAHASGPEHEAMRERARQLRSEAEAQRSAQARARAQAAPPPPAQPLEPAPAVEPSPEARPELAPPAAEPAAPRASASLRGPRTLLVLAGSLAAGALGAALWWSERTSAVETCNPADGRVCVEQAQIARQERAAMGLTLSLGVSAGVLAAGGAIWLVQRKRDVRGAQLSAWGARRAAGLALRGTF